MTNINSDEKKDENINKLKCEIQHKSAVWLEKEKNNYKQLLQ